MPADFFKHKMYKNGPYKVLHVRDTNLVIKKRLRECVVNKANCALYKGDITLLKGLR